MYEDGVSYCSGWNFGPSADSIVPVKYIVEIIIEEWGYGKYVDISTGNAPHQTSLLSLDCIKARTYLKWSPKLTVKEALNFTVDWYKHFNDKDAYDLCVNQIKSYCKK